MRALQRRRNRATEQLFLAEGVRVVEELLRSGLDLRFAVVSPTLEDSERGRALAAQLAERAPVRHVKDAQLAALAATETPQGVLMVARTPTSELAALDITGSASVLVLDAIQDPGNLGTLVRTADALGAAFVAALPGTVDPWNPKAVRAAAGASFRVPIVEQPLPVLSEWLRERGFALFGTDAAGTAIERVRLSQRTALVVGNEGAGLSDAVRAAVDAVVAVPIRAGAESLNVAVAAAILLYEITRRR